MQDEEYYENLVQQAIENIAMINRRARLEKKEVINRLAENLDRAGMPQQTICDFIVKKLVGYASPTHVRNWLDNKYKDPTQARNARKRGRKEIQLLTDSSSELATPVLPDNPEESNPDATDSATESDPDNHLLSPTSPSSDISIKAVGREELEKVNRITKVSVSKDHIDQMKKLYPEVDRRCYLYLDANGQLVKIVADTQTPAWKRRAIEKKANSLARLEAQWIRLGA